MNKRRIQINDIFHLLDEHRQDQAKFEEVLNRLELKIREEQLQDNNRNTK